jgi:formylmethanofuran dehydrogenase subunit E
MPNSKQVKCSVCGKPIKTASGAVAMNSAPLVCRRCFGEQSYSGSSHWVQNLTQNQQSSDS